MSTRAPRSGKAALWTAAAMAAGLAHGGLALALLAPTSPSDPGAPAGAFVVELAAVPVARQDIPVDIAPGPDQVAAAALPDAPKPEHEEVVEAKPEPQSEPEPVVPPPLQQPVVEPEVALPRPAEKVAEVAPPESQPQTPAPATTMTQVEPRDVAPVAAAPAIGPASKVVADALPTWRTKLETALERSKRYPGHALARGHQGIVHVTFVIDRQGALLSSQVTRSSGHALLDDEALALLTRAQPFPSPPQDLRGERISIAVPIRFNLR